MNDVTISSANENSLCSFTASQNEHNTYSCKTATYGHHFVLVLIFCALTEQLFTLFDVLSNYELHTTILFTDVMVNT